MSIQERLHQVIDQLKLSPSAFADRIGVQRSNLSHVLSGRNKPGLDFLEKIIIHFPAIDAHWLLTGKEKEVSLEAEVKNKKTGDHNSISMQGVKKIRQVVLVYTDNTFEVLNGL